MKKLFNSIGAVLTAPFKWGYQVVDSRPPGSVYRRVSHQLHAVETGVEGEIAFVVGNGLTDKRPVVETIQASTPAEAANATLQMMGGLRRSKAREVNRVHKTLVAEHRKAVKAAEAAAPAGNAAQCSTGSLTPSSDVSGPAGEVLMPA